MRPPESRVVYVAPAEGLDSTTVPPSESVAVTTSSAVTITLPPGATATMGTGEVVTIVEPAESVCVMIVAGAMADVTTV